MVFYIHVMIETSARDHHSSYNGDEITTTYFIVGVEFVFLKGEGLSLFPLLQ